MRKLWQALQRDEKRFIAWISLALILLTGLPYIYGWLAQPDGLHYLGITALTPSDNFVYYSYINQVREGSTTLRDLFTPEAQPDGLLNIFWLLVGWFARVLHLSAPVAFHLVRVLLIWPLVALAYIFFSLFLQKSQWRKLALFLLAFSSGVGAYVAAPLYIVNPAIPTWFSPNDIWVPESVTFLAVYKTPHFIASLVMMLSIFIYTHLGFVEKKMQYILTAGVLALLYFNFHPFYIPAIFGTIGLYWLFRVFHANRILWTELGYCVVIGLLSLPSIVYHWLALQANPVLAGRAFQNVTLSPPWYFLLPGYGLLWVLAAVGIFILYRQKKLERYFLPLAWLVICVVFTQLPAQFQSRYTQGLHIVLVLFSVLGIASLLYKHRDDAEIRSWTIKNTPILLVIFVMLGAISNLFVLTRDIYYLHSQPGNISNYLYVSEDLAAQVQKLATLQSAIVFSGPQNSLVLSSFTHHQTYAGHTIESLDFVQRLFYVQWFFSKHEQLEQKHEWVKKNKFTYLLYTPNEKKIGSLDPTQVDWLVPVDQHNEVVLYKIIQ